MTTKNSRLRIGYGKLSRSVVTDYDRHGFTGDAEAPNLLRRLAMRNPHVTWVIIGRNTGGTLGLPNVENPFDGEEYTGSTFVTIRDGAPPRPDITPNFVSRSGEVIGAVKAGVERDRRIEDIIASLDGAVIHLGECGMSMPVPMVESTWAEARADPSKFVSTYNQYRNYGEFLVNGLNRLGDRTDGRAPVIWICADIRTRLKDRAVKWPTGCDAILGQYDGPHRSKHDRFEDLRSPTDIGFEYGLDITVERGGEIWAAEHRYQLADLELMILPDNWRTWGSRNFDEREPVGVASTSYNVGSPRRSEMIRDIVLAAFPGAPVYGKWDRTSLTDVPPGTVIENDPSDFSDILGRFRVTLSLPALGSAWTVAKPYQCFAARSLCFMYGELDDLGWILPTRSPGEFVPRPGVEMRLVASPDLYSIRNDWTHDDLELARFLRVKTTEEFAERADFVAGDPRMWKKMVNRQRALLERRWNATLLERTIEQRLGIDGTNVEDYDAVLPTPQRRRTIEPVVGTTTTTAEPIDAEAEEDDPRQITFDWS